MGCTFDNIDSTFGQQRLVLVNYACGFHQSEMGKYFEWIIIIRDIYHQDFCVNCKLQTIDLGLMWSIYDIIHILNCGCRWKWRIIIAVNFPIWALIFSGLFFPVTQIGKLTVLIILHFHLQPQFKIWIVSYTLHIISLLMGEYELNKLTLLPMCGSIAQLVEHRTGICGDHGFKSHWSPDFFRLLPIA